MLTLLIRGPALQRDSKTSSSAMGCEELVERTLCSGSNETNHRSSRYTSGSFYPCAVGMRLDLRWRQSCKIRIRISMVCGQYGNLLQSLPSELVRVPAQVRGLICSIGMIFTYPAIGRRGLSRQGESSKGKRVVSRGCPIKFSVRINLSVTLISPSVASQYDKLPSGPS